MRMMSSLKCVDEWKKNDEGVKSEGGFARWVHVMLYIFETLRIHDMKSSM